VITIGASRPLSSRSILWQMVAGRSPARIRVASDWLRGARTTLLTDDIRPGLFNRFRIVCPLGIDAVASARSTCAVHFDGGAGYQV
jgi:hypothetical protein